MKIPKTQARDSEFVVTTDYGQFVVPDEVVGAYEYAYFRKSAKRKSIEQAHEKLFNDLSGFSHYCFLACLNGGEILKKAHKK